MSRRQRILRRTTWVLVAVIAGIAFAASFEAIAEYAGQVGWGSRMRFTAPLLVDTFTLAAGLVILARSEDGERAVYAWSLLVAASAVSIGLNIAHAPDHRAAQIVAALPPAALLAAVELAMSEARRSRKPASVNPPAEVGGRVPDSPGRVPAPTSRAAATSPRVQTPLAPGGRAPAERDWSAELENLSATIAAHAYDDRGERMGERRVRPALEAAGHVIPRAVVRQALADLPERRNGHKVVAQ